VTQYKAGKASNFAQGKRRYRYDSRRLQAAAGLRWQSFKNDHSAQNTM
jgi:ribosomal protein L44E